MPRNKSSLSDVGSVETHGREFRAHINLRDGGGKQLNVRGPCRATEKEAQKDLDQIRAAGAIGTTRDEALKIMVAKARRI